MRSTGSCVGRSDPILGRKTAPPGWAGQWNRAGRDMTGQGHRIFVDRLARFAAAAADPRVTATAKRVASPLRVAVCGRPGVGRRTVAHALDRAGLPSGITVTARTDPVDVTVYVMAEVVKSEDRDAVAALPH